MTDLDSRYGRPRPMVRIVALTLVVALAVSAVGFLGWAVIFQSTPDVQSRLVAFERIDQHAAEATVTVSRDEESTQASCRLIAYASDHSTVGETDFEVTSGPEVQQLLVAVRTDRLADSIELVGCTSPDQPRAR